MFDSIRIEPAPSRTSQRMVLESLRSAILSVEQPMFLLSAGAATKFHLHSFNAAFGQLARIGEPPVHAGAGARQLPLRLARSLQHHCNDCFLSGRATWFQADIGPPARSLPWHISLLPVGAPPAVSAIVGTLSATVPGVPTALPRPRATYDPLDAGPTANPYAAGLSEDLRGPLNNILGLCRLLLADPPDRQERKLVTEQIMGVAADALQRMDAELALLGEPRGPGTASVTELDALVRDFAARLDAACQLDHIHAGAVVTTDASLLRGLLRAIADDLRNAVSGRVFLRIGPAALENRKLKLVTGFEAASGAAPAFLRARALARAPCTLKHHRIDRRHRIEITFPGTVGSACGAERAGLSPGVARAG